MENKSLGPSFCSYFWNHICVRPDFQLKPCCRFEMDDYPQQIWSSSFSETINSSFYKDLRAKSLAGEKIKGCEKCYKQEKAGIISLREIANKTEIKSKTLETSVEDITYLECFVGSTCNLKCMMCTPELSTSWHKDYVDLGWPTPPLRETPDIAKAIETLSNLEEVKFVGGEPFLAKQHADTLEVLSRQKADKIALTYFTNGTVWPKQEILDQWNHFKEINLWLSIDGFGGVNDYIRFPSQWQEVEKNFIRYIEHSKVMSNLNLRVMATISVYNIFDLNNLEKWYLKIKDKHQADKLFLLLFNPLTQPSFLSPTNLPQELIDQVIESMDLESKEQKKMAAFLKEHQTPFDDQLLLYTRSLDKVRKLNISDYIPELSTLIYPESFKN